MPHLLLEASKYSSLKSSLIESYSDIDDETLSDTLHGATNAEEFLTLAIRSSIDDEFLAKALKLRLDDMKRRLGRLEIAQDRKRDLVLKAMTLMGVGRFIQPDFTAFVRAGGGAAEVLDEKRIPDRYWLPQPPKLDRAGLLQELKAGADIPGVALSSGAPALTIRRS